MEVRRGASVSALPRGAVPIEVVSRLRLRLPGGLEGGLKGLLGVRGLLPRQSLRQDPPDHSLLPLLLALVGSTNVAYLRCVAGTGAVVTSGPLLSSVPRCVRGGLWLSHVRRGD